jgi:outer membrane biosynthesis protein TonB
MKALLIACILLFVAFCVFIAVQSGDSAHKPATIINAWEQPSKETPAPNAPKPLEVSALKLFVDYQRNEVAADNMYKGRLLAVRGMVTSISKNMFDKIYVSLATPNEFMNVQVHLGEGNESQAAALQRGEVINVICTGGGMILGSPMLTDCSFAADVQDSSEKTPTEPSIAVADKPLAAMPAVQQNDEPVASDGTTRPLNPETQIGANEVHKIGGQVSVPILLSSAEPEFPEEARKAKVGCNVLVNMLIGTDGLPNHVHVIRRIYIDQNGNASSSPFGAGDLGFDEKAIAAAQQYRFRPATQNGVPVVVELNVELKFQTF